MTTKPETKNQKTTEIAELLKSLGLLVEYGSIKIQIRDSKPTLIILEKTIKLD